MTIKFSQQIEDLLAQNQLTLQQVLEQTKTASFGFVLCLVALPSALPVPAPGFSVPFGMMIVFLAMQLLLGRKTLWLPASWLQKSINLRPYHGKIKGVLKFVRFFEWFVRPRLGFMYRFGLPLLSFMMLLCGLSMLIPIPGTNSLPALGVFLISLGMLEKDGLAALAGVGAGLLGLVLTTTILWFGGQGLVWLWESLPF